MDELIRLVNEGKLRDNLYDVRWKLHSRDKQVMDMSRTIRHDVCNHCSGYMVEVAIDKLDYRSFACMSCGCYTTIDEQASGVIESGGGYGSIQLVSTDRSLVLNYGFTEPMDVETLRTLSNELLNFLNVDSKHCFIRTLREENLVYWLGEEVKSHFYDDLFGMNTRGVSATS